MVTFTRIPAQHATLGGSLNYTFASDAPATFLLRMTNARTGRHISTVRFVGVSGATFDVAPILRRTVSFKPAVGDTGLSMASSRYVEVDVALYDAEGTTLLVAASTRTFIAAVPAVVFPSIATTMPAVRLLGYDECEELLLLPDTAQTLRVRGEGTTEIAEREYALEAMQPVILRIDARDFAGAESVTVDGGTCGTVTYHLMPVQAEGVRLAWRSSRGSVEHYTFPVVCERGVVAEGSASRERWRVVSAYESEAVVGALAEMLSSPQVWVSGRNSYIPVEVTTKSAVVRRAGAMSMLEIEFLTTENPQSWS